MTSNPIPATSCPPETLDRLPHLASSLLQVLLPDEVRALHLQPEWNGAAGRSSRTLVKYPDLRIVLVSMKAGARIPQHKTGARFALLTLSGHVRLHTPEASLELSSGELLALDRDVPHEVEAVRQCTFLLIMSWPDRRQG